MSRENVETIRRSNKAFNRRDKAVWLDCFDADVVMVPARGWPENAPTRGAEELWDFYLNATGPWEDRPFEVGEVIDSGTGKVAANIRLEARGKTSGAGVEFSYWVVWTFRDGRGIRLEWFAKRADALEAAGLRE